MPGKRPAPLLDELLESGPTGQQPAPNVGMAMLLGRINNIMPVVAKKSVGDVARTTPTKQSGIGEVSQPATPGIFRRTVTPIASQQQWCFTPIATPSPSSRFTAFEHHRWGMTPGARAAAAAKSGSNPPALLAGAFSAAAAAQEPPVTSAWAAGLMGSLPVTQVASYQGPGILSLHEALRPFKDTSPKRRDDDSDSDDASSQGEQTLRSLKAAASPPPGALHPSIGSASHAIGACKRCCFFPRGRCMNGYDCEFCHYEHEKRKRKNKKKGKQVASCRLQGAQPVLSQASSNASKPCVAGLCAALGRGGSHALSIPATFATGSALVGPSHMDLPDQVTVQDLGFHSIGSAVPIARPFLTGSQAPTKAQLQPQPGRSASFAHDAPAAYHTYQVSPMLQMPCSSAIPPYQATYQVGDTSYYMQQALPTMGTGVPFCAAPPQPQAISMSIGLSMVAVDSAMPQSFQAAVSWHQHQPPNGVQQRLPIADQHLAQAYAAVPPPPMQPPKLQWQMPF